MNKDKKLNYNAVNLFDKVVQQQPKSNSLLAPSLIGDYHVLSYQELQNKSIVVRDWLLSQNVKSGDKVLLLLPLSTELYLAIIALFRIGAIGVLYEPKDIFWQLNRTTKQVFPDCVLTTRKINLFLQLNKSYRSIKRRIFIEDAFNNKSKEYSHEPLTILTLANDPALINFTSGSEGIPKGICRTHNFLIKQNEILQKYMQLNKNDTILTTLPVFVLSMFAAGSFVIIPKLRKNLPWLPNSQSLDLIKKYNANIILGASAFVQQLIKESLNKDKRLSSIRRVIVGGCFLEKDLIIQLKSILPDKTNIEIIYGSTEVEPVSHVNIEQLNDIWENYSYQGYCVGKPIKEVKARIIHFSKDPIKKSRLDFLPKGRFGELIVSGIHVNERYVPQEPAFSNNKIIDTSGRLWHRMGDGAYYDKEDRLWLVGRFKHLPQVVLDNFSNYLDMEATLKKVYNTSKISLVESKGGLILYIECGFWDRMNYKKKSKSYSIIRQHGFLCDKIYLKRRLPRDRRHNSKLNYGELIRSS